MVARTFQPTLSATTDNQGNCTFTMLGPAGSGDAVQCTISILGASGGNFVAQIAKGVQFGAWSGPQPFGPITYQAMQTLTIAATGLLPNTIYLAQIIGIIDDEAALDPTLPTSTGTTALMGTSPIANLPAITLAPLAVYAPPIRYFSCSSFAALRLAAVLASAPGPVTIEAKWWNANVTAQMGYRRYIIGPTAPNLEVAIPHLGDQLELDISNLNTAGFGAYDAAVLALSPTLYWETDETSGTTAADATGNGHTGTYTGLTLGHQPSPIVSDPTSRYVTGGIANADIAAAASTAWDTTTFTLLAWVRPAAGGATQIIGGVLNPNLVNIRWYAYIDGTGTIHLDSQTAPMGLGGASLVAGSWSFVAITWDDSGAGTGKAYVNGVQSGIGGNGHLTATTTNQPFTAAGNPSGGSQLRGDLTRVALFPTVLSAAQILALYNAAIGAIASSTLSLCATHTTQPHAAFGGLDIANANTTTIPSSSTGTVVLAPAYVFGGPAHLMFNPGAAVSAYQMNLQAQQPDGSWNTFVSRSNADPGVRQEIDFYLPTQPIRLLVAQTTGSPQSVDAALTVDLHRVG